VAIDKIECPVGDLPSVKQPFDIRLFYQHESMYLFQSVGTNRVILLELCSGWLGDGQKSCRALYSVQNYRSPGRVNQNSEAVLIVSVLT
jgi:hypothetical protein